MSADGDRVVRGMRTGTPTDSTHYPAEIGHADALVGKARTEPESTIRAATQLLAASAVSPAVRIRLRHAIALARTELGELTAAAAEIERAVRLAEHAEIRDQLGRLLLTRAWIQLDRAADAACLADLDTADPLLRGTDLARSRCLRGLALHIGGRHDAAERELSAAILLLRQGNDQHWLANAFNARASVRCYLLRLNDADDDFAAASTLYKTLGEVDRAACCLHNRGFVASMSGNLAGALDFFAAAERAGVDFDRHPELLADQVQALLAAGLATDAQRCAERAANKLAMAGRSSKLAEAVLSIAECSLLAENPAVAKAVAGQAVRMFRMQRRHSWFTAARAMSLRAELACSGRHGRASAAARRIAAECERLGWPVLAAELRLAAAEHAKPAVAVELLAAVAAGRRAESGELAMLGWLARARLAARRDDRRGVFTATRAGLRAAVGRPMTTDVPYRQSSELTGLGLAAAVRSGRPRSVLYWSDRHRGAAHSYPPVRPDRQPELAEALLRLRMAQTANRGDPSPRSRGELAECERRVRRVVLAHSVRETGMSQLDCSALTEVIGDAVLLSFIAHRGELLVVSVTGQRFRLHRLAPESRIVELIDALRFTSGPLPGIDWPVSGAADTATRRSAMELDRLLLRPLSNVLRDRPLVVVPCATLRTLPWSALPSCTGRPVSVSASIVDWLNAVRSENREGGRTVWIAGPGLRHAEPEVRSLHAVGGGALLSAGESTVENVLDAMSGADLVHIAAHGVFREDQPLLSGLEMANGFLYGYDFDRLRVPPRLLVLSACEVGRSAARPGDRLLGLASTVLRRGTATVIASLSQVADSATVALMADVHRGLRNGQGPAVSLAKAQATHGDHGFICFGAG